MAKQNKHGIKTPAQIEKEVIKEFLQPENADEAGTIKIEGEFQAKKLIAEVNMAMTILGYVVKLTSIDDKGVIISRREFYPLLKEAKKRVTSWLNAPRPPKAEVRWQWIVHPTEKTITDDPKIDKRFPEPLSKNRVRKLMVWNHYGKEVVKAVVAQITPMTKLEGEVKLCLDGLYTATVYMTREAKVQLRQERNIKTQEAAETLIEGFFSELSTEWDISGKSLEDKLRFEQEEAAKKRAYERSLVVNEIRRKAKPEALRMMDDQVTPDWLKSRLGLSKK